MNERRVRVYPGYSVDESINRDTLVFVFIIACGLFLWLAVGTLIENVHAQSPTTVPWFSVTSGSSTCKASKVIQTPIRVSYLCENKYGATAGSYTADATNGTAGGNNFNISINSVGNDGTNDSVFCTISMNSTAGPLMMNGATVQANSESYSCSGGGGGGGPSIAGTANEIAVAGAGCTNPSMATCTISIPSSPVLLGNPSTPGTFSTGVGSGKTGAVEITGATSGATSVLTVDATNTETTVNLPNDAMTSGLYMTTSPTATPVAGCAQYNGTGTQASSTGVPCGSGSGTAGGGVLGYSASALTLPTAGTTFLAPVGGALASTTEANVTANAPAAAAISMLYVSISSAPGTGNSVAFTYRDAGSSTALTCTISGATATTCNDITHSFTPTVGDAISIQVVTSGTVVIAPAIKIIAEYP